MADDFVQGRAQGINAVMHLGFQSSFTTPAPVDTYYKIPFDSDQVRGRAPLGQDTSLGHGRDGVDPFVDAKDVTGDLVVPMEPRTIGLHLKGLFGVPVSSVASLAATGALTFRAQPGAGSKFALNGVEWTFVAAAPSANQILIGANLAATLTAAAVALNASANAEVAKCTYVATTKALNITFDTLGHTGNSYTLTAEKATNARVSWATLRGGAYTHTFHSGGVGMGIVTLEASNPEVSSYRAKIGVMYNTMQLGMTRAGRLIATFGMIGYNELPSAETTIVGEDVTEWVYDDVLVQRDGAVYIDGELAGDVTASDITISNGLAIVPGLRGNGLIGGIDIGELTTNSNLTIRFRDAEMQWKAENKVPMSVERRWGARAGMSLSITEHRVFLPVEGPGISGSGGLENQYATMSGKDPVLGRKLTVVLTNDVVSYA